MSMSDKFELFRFTDELRSNHKAKDRLHTLKNIQNYDHEVERVTKRSVIL